MKKNNIIEAALRLLASNGVHATPMSAIAKAANTGMGTIYNYFPTKEKLINAIYVDIKQREETLLLVPSKKRTVKSQFEHYYLVVTEFYLKNPDCFRFMDQLNGSPIISEESRAEGYRAIRPVINIIEQGQQEGLIKNIKIEELLQFIGGAVLAHLGWVIYSKNTKEKPSLKNQLRLIWDAIKK